MRFVQPLLDGSFQGIAGQYRIASHLGDIAVEFQTNWVDTFADLLSGVAGYVADLLTQSARLFLGRAAHELVFFSDDIRELRECRWIAGAARRAERKYRGKSAGHDCDRSRNRNQHVHDHPSCPGELNIVGFDLA